MLYRRTNHMQFPMSDWCLLMQITEGVYMWRARLQWTAKETNCISIIDAELCSQTISLTQSRSGLANFANKILCPVRRGPQATQPVQDSVIDSSCLQVGWLDLLRVNSHLACSMFIKCYSGSKSYNGYKRLKRLKPSRALNGKPIRAMESHLPPDTSEPQPTRPVLDLPTPEGWKAELT